MSPVPTREAKAKAHDALRMRVDGKRWQEIADEVGYASAGAAYNAVHRLLDVDYWRRRAAEQDAENEQARTARRKRSRS
ncbi:hypothetical protein HJD18_08170 [Thermoleophilia bacterium SCSIO 60948]|nr:hypothetical protein HJD18_08170 [Thermoleophilia bacterium SCSIO 60948]